MKLFLLPLLALAIVPQAVLGCANGGDPCNRIGERVCQCAAGCIVSCEYVDALLDTRILMHR